MVCAMAGQTIITRMFLIGPTCVVPLLHTIQDHPLAMEDLVSSLVLPLCPSNLLLIISDKMNSEYDCKFWVGNKFSS